MSSKKGVGASKKGGKRPKKNKSERPNKNIYNSLSRNNAPAPAELFRKDLISAMKLPDSEYLAPDEYWLINDPWKEEWEKGVQVPVAPDSIPEPRFRKIEVFLPPNRPSFKLPKRMIHLEKDEHYDPDIHHLPPSPNPKHPAYDLDSLDVNWLNIFNEERKRLGLSSIKEITMEHLIEEFEKECATKIQEQLWLDGVAGLEYDDNAVCDVCRTPDAEEGNEIVFCDACNVGVHQACYGVVNIPAGSWVCRTCALGISPRCVLCPNTNGAMKPTKNGSKWAHVSCALWIPEVVIGNPEKMEPISKLSEIPASRWNLVCSLCRKRDGACIQCSIKKCKTAYHVTCAFNAGLKMSQSLENNVEDVNMKSYCRRHSKDKAAKVLEDGDEDETSLDASDLGALRQKFSNCPTPTQSDDLSRTKYQSAAIEAEFYKWVKPDIIAMRTKVSHDIADFIYNYWKLKRLANFNKPLMKVKLGEEKPLLTKERKEKGLVMRTKMFISIRQELERLRNLNCMVIKREKFLRALSKRDKEIFEKQYQLINNFPEVDVHEVLRATKPQSYFEQIYHPAYLQIPDDRLSEEMLQQLQKQVKGGSDAAKPRVQPSFVYKTLHQNPPAGEDSESDAFYESEDESYEEPKSPPTHVPLPLNNLSTTQDSPSKAADASFIESSTQTPIPSPEELRDESQLSENSPFNFENDLNSLNTSKETVKSLPQIIKDTSFEELKTKIPSSPNECLDNELGKVHHNKSHSKAAEKVHSPRKHTTSPSKNKQKSPFKSSLKLIIKENKKLSTSLSKTFEKVVLKSPKKSPIKIDEREVFVDVEKQRIKINIKKSKIDNKGSPLKDDDKKPIESIEKPCATLDSTFITPMAPSKAGEINALIEPIKTSKNNSSELPKSPLKENEKQIIVKLNNSEYEDREEVALTDFPNPNNLLNDKKLPLINQEKIAPKISDDSPLDKELIAKGMEKSDQKTPQDSPPKNNIKILENEASPNKLSVQNKLKTPAVVLDPLRENDIKEILLLSQLKEAEDPSVKVKRSKNHSPFKDKLASSVKEMTIGKDFQKSSMPQTKPKLHGTSNDKTKAKRSRSDSLSPLKGAKKKKLKLSEWGNLYVDLNLYDAFKADLKDPLNISPKVLISGSANLRGKTKIHHLKCENKFVSIFEKLSQLKSTSSHKKEIGSHKSSIKNHINNSFSSNESNKMQTSKAIPKTKPSLEDVIISSSDLGFTQGIVAPEVISPQKEEKAIKCSTPKEKYTKRSSISLEKIKNNFNLAKNHVKLQRSRSREIIDELPTVDSIKRLNFDNDSFNISQPSVVVEALPLVSLAEFSSTLSTTSSLPSHNSTTSTLSSEVSGKNSILSPIKELHCSASSESPLSISHPHDSCSSVEGGKLYSDPCPGSSFSNNDSSLIDMESDAQTKMCSLAPRNMPPQENLASSKAALFVSNHVHHNLLSFDEKEQHCSDKSDDKAKEQSSSEINESHESLSNSITPPFIKEHDSTLHLGDDNKNMEKNNCIFDRPNENLEDPKTDNSKSKIITIAENDITSLLSTNNDCSSLLEDLQNVKDQDSWETLECMLEEETFKDGSKNLSSPSNNSEALLKQTTIPLISSPVKDEKLSNDLNSKEIKLNDEILNASLMQQSPTISITVPSREKGSSPEARDAFTFLSSLSSKDLKNSSCIINKNDGFDGNHVPLENPEAPSPEKASRANGKFSHNAHHSKSKKTQDGRLSPLLEGRNESKDGKREERLHKHHYKSHKSHHHEKSHHHHQALLSSPNEKTTIHHNQNSSRINGTFYTKKSPDSPTSSSKGSHRSRHNMGSSSNRCNDNLRWDATHLSRSPQKNTLRDSTVNNSSLLPPDYLSSASAPSAVIGPSKLAGYKIPKRLKPDDDKKALPNSPLSRLTSINGHASSFSKAREKHSVSSPPFNPPNVYHKPSSLPPYSSRTITKFKDKDIPHLSHPPINYKA